MKTGLSNIDKVLFWADQWLAARRQGSDGADEDRHLAFAYAQLSIEEKEKYWQERVSTDVK